MAFELHGGDSSRPADLAVRLVMQVGAFCLRTDGAHTVGGSVFSQMEYVIGTIATNGANAACG